MTCADHQQNLESYLRHELSPKKALALEDHLQKCDSCKDELEDFKAILGQLKALPKPNYSIPKNLIADAIKSDRSAPKRRQSPTRRQSKRKQALPYILAPVVIIVLLSLLWTLNKTPNNIDTKVQPGTSTPKIPPSLPSAPPKIRATKSSVKKLDSQKATKKEVPGTKQNTPPEPQDVIAKVEKKSTQPVLPKPSQVSPKASQVPKEVNKNGGSEVPSAAIVAKVTRGKERVLGYQGSKIRSKQLLQTRPGQSGICLSMDGATVFLGGSSRATISGGAICLLEGELLVDRRDLETGTLSLKFGEERVELGAGTRVLLSVRAKERLTIFNGSIKIFGNELGGGQQFDLKKRRRMLGKFFKEPRWVRKLRDKKIVLFDLQADLVAKIWLWGKAEKETVKTRTL
ncbi:MAG: zf-HC2 domain-containing protein, partial [Planctomycetota bacterium]|nr:zf-HC2 domain-containing protein [Planctomycetota bacterium]